VDRPTNGRGFGTPCHHGSWHPRALRPRWLEAALHEVQAWTERRNAGIKDIDWQFRTDEARTKLKRLYPECKP
jgi:hypothetical protein